MQALGLGKVSRDKQQQATASDDTITADCDGRNRRHSHREVPKRWQHEHLERDEEQGHGNK